MFFFSSKLFSEEMTFENFKNNSSSKNWEFISDQVMGGLSSGTYKIFEEENENFLRLTGQVSLENNGGFIQVRKKVIAAFKKDVKGIKITSRGNETEYFLHIRTKYTLLPWQYYQLKFKVSKKWETYNLYLKDFVRSGSLLPKKINPKHINSIAIVAYGREHYVKLDVSEIKLF